MKKLLLVLAFGMALSACSSFKPDAAQSEFIAEFGRTLKLPLKADSAFLTNLDTLDAMGLDRINKLLRDSMERDLAGDLKSGLQGCKLIEELKQSGRYSAYVDSLQIGMLKNATAFTVGKVMLKNGRPLLIWGINEGSYEACPFFSGTSLIASYPQTGGGFKHIVVAENYNAGDPPSFMSKRTWSEITESQVALNSRIVSEDGEPGHRNSELLFTKLEVRDGDLAVSARAEGK